MKVGYLYALGPLAFALVTPVGAAQADVWTSGATMPTARVCAAAGAVGANIYVLGGRTATKVVSKNEIYNTQTNTWSTGAPMPTARWCFASAVVNGILYAIGGNDGSSQLNVVEAYDPATNTWTTKTPMPTTRDSETAAVIGGQFVYVVGGFNQDGGRLDTVEAYDTATDSWSAKAPLRVGKSIAAVGAVGATIIAAGGLSSTGITRENESDATGKNVWRKRTKMPTGRESACTGVINGLLYVAGGNGLSLKRSHRVLEAYDHISNSWNTALASMPHAAGGPAYATVNGQLYCFGGGDRSSNVLDYVQIYLP